MVLLPAALLRRRTSDEAPILSIGASWRKTDQRSQALPRFSYPSGSAVRQEARRTATALRRINKFRRPVLSGIAISQAASRLDLSSEPLAIYCRSTSCSGVSMEITAEMALRELRRRGTNGGVKDRSEASRRRARSEGTMELSNKQLRSIAGTMGHEGAQLDSPASPRLNGPPALPEISGRIPVSSSSAPNRKDQNPDASEVETLIGEFRSAHQMVSKAEIRELRQQLPRWLAEHPYESVRTAIRRGPTVAHVERLVTQISARRSHLEKDAGKRRAGAVRSTSGTRTPARPSRGAHTTNGGQSAKGLQPPADSAGPPAVRQPDPATHRHHPSGHGTPIDEAALGSGTAEHPDGYSAQVDRSATPQRSGQDGDGAAVLSSDAERAIYLRFDMKANGESGLLGAMCLRESGGTLWLQHYDLGGCELESTVQLRPSAVDHQRWRSLTPELAIHELIALARSEDRLLLAWSPDTLSAMLELDLPDPDRRQLQRRFRSGLDLATSWRNRQPTKPGFVAKDSIAAFMDAAGIPAMADSTLEDDQDSSNPVIRAFRTVTKNYRRLTELRSLINRIAIRAASRDTLRPKATRLAPRGPASRSRITGWGGPDRPILPGPLSDLLSEEVGEDLSLRFWADRNADEKAEDVLARAVRLSGARWQEVGDVPLGQWPDADDLEHWQLTPRTLNTVRRHLHRLDEPVTLGKLMAMPNMGIRGAIDFASALEVSGLGAGSSTSADPVVISSLEHVEELAWAGEFRSNFIGLSAPLDFTSLRDECAALRRKLTTNSTPARINRAEKLLSLASRVEEFNRLGLQDAAGRILTYAAPTADGEAALHAYIGLGGYRPGSSSESAAATGLSRQRFLRLKGSVRRSSVGRVWLPQLEEAISALEASVARAGVEPDPREARVVSAIADVLGTDDQLQRLGDIDALAVPDGASAADLIDIENQIRRMAEPYGFVRVSDAIDKLIGAGVTTSLPDLQKRFAGIPDASPLADGWWWLSTAGGEQAPAVRVATKVAYVAARPFTGSDLRRALLRHAAAKAIENDDEAGSVPPGEVLVSWGSLVEALSVDEQSLLDTTTRPGDEILSELEMTIVEILVFSRGGVCDTENLLAQVREHGSQKHLGVDHLRSLAILDEVADGIWSLCGAEHDPQIVDLLKKRHA